MDSGTSDQRESRLKTPERGHVMNESARCKRFVSIEFALWISLRQEEDNYSRDLSEVSFLDC